MGKPATIAGLIHAGLDVLSTTVSAQTKKILAQVGNVLKSAADADQVEWIQSVGFASRPAKPVAGKASAQCVVLRTSDRDIAIASQDLRGLELYGNLDHGETCVYAPGDDGNGQARALLKKNGSISLYTRVGNKADGAGMIIQLDAENDAIRITNGKGYGLIIDADGARMFTGGTGACVTLGADGKCSMVGTGQAQIDGSSIVLGSIAVPGVNNCIVGPAGIAGQASQKVMVAIV